MDNITHSLFGLTLARTPLSRAGRGTTAALFLASNVPDIDIVATAFGGAARYLEVHRGPTHGPLGLAGLSFVVAGLVWLGTRRRADASGPPGASLAALWLASAIGIFFHVLMDLPTSYGTRPLSPFSWTWYGLDWLPIVDLYLLGILGVGAWLGHRAQRRPDAPRRLARNAAVTLAAVAAFYALRAGSHYLAIARAPDAFALRQPPWCAQSVRPALGVDWWPRFPGTSPRDVAAQDCLIEIAAMPDFLSPFRWRLLSHESLGYQVRDIDLATGYGLDRDDPAARARSVVVPSQWTPAVMSALRAPNVRVFMDFSRFPSPSSSLHDDGTYTVMFSDMRFTGGLPSDARTFRRGLFGATAVVGRDYELIRDSLGPDPPVQ